MERNPTSDASRLSLLKRAAELLLSAADMRGMAQRLAEVVVPELADWCAVHVVTDEGALEGEAVMHVDPAKVSLARDLWARYPVDPNATNGAPQVVRTGAYELATEIPDAMLEAAAQDEEHLRLLRELGLRSYVVTPLSIGGEVFGALTLVHAESGRQFTSADLPGIEDITAIAALGLANARSMRQRQKSLENERAARRAAEQSAKELRALLDNLPALAWTARPDGFIDFYNRRWFEYTGTTAEQMQGWGWQEVHDPALLPSVVEQWRRSLERGEPFEMEVTLRSKEGDRRWFLARVEPSRDGDGAISRWFGTCTDIHDLRAARALAEEIARHANETRQAIEDMREARDRAQARVTELERRLGGE